MIWNRPDHQQYWQINIDDLSLGDADPLIEQQEGEIYWLDLNIQTAGGGLIGWKTSLAHFNDAAVVNVGGAWFPMFDPINGEQLDMAFVITPEPGSAMLALLGAGLCCLRRCKR